MSKSKKNSKTSKSRKANTAKYDHPGRPMYDPSFPRTKEFTFTDFEVANGVNPKTGKGKECTTLTLRKWLKRDKARMGKSILVLLKGVTADPNSRKGLGRRAHLFSLRSKVNTTRTPRVTQDAPSDVSPETKSYEATKAALLADTSVPVTAPATPEPQPEVTPTPAPAPVEAVPAAVVEAAPIANETPAPAPQAEVTPAPSAEVAPAPQS